MKIINSILALFKMPGPLIGLVFIAVNSLNWAFLKADGVSTKPMLIALILIFLIMFLAALWHLVIAIYLFFRRQWAEGRMALQAFVLTYMLHSAGLSIDASLLYLT